MLCWKTLPALVAGVARADALMARPIGWATMVTNVEAWHASVAPNKNVNDKWERRKVTCAKASSK